MLGIKPKWYNSLPDFLRPLKSEVERIENFRKQYNIPHDYFVSIFSHTYWCFCKYLDSQYENLKRTNRNMHEKDIWREIVITFLESKKKDTNKLLTDYELDNLITEIDMKKYDSFLNVKNFLYFDVEENDRKKANPNPMVSNALSELDLILRYPNS